MAFALPLVRAFLKWSRDADEVGIETAVSGFRAWLQHSDPALAAGTTDETLVELVSYHQKRTESRAAGRREQRVQEQLQVLLSVREGSVASRCDTNDTGVHGMCLNSKVALPNDAVVDLTVAPQGFPITMLNLEAECKWVAPATRGYKVGVEVRESADFERWRQRFVQHYSDAVSG